MRITPLDVRKQEFRRVVRGCDADEVKAFLSTVADEYEAVLRDNKTLRERIMSLEEKVGEYERMEKALRDTLMTAERVLSEAKDGARKEAELIVKDAQMRAHQALETFRQEADAMRREMLALQREKEGFLARFRSLSEAQLQFVENHQGDVRELDRRLQEISDRFAVGVAVPRASAADSPRMPTRAAPAGKPTADHARAAPVTEPAANPAYTAPAAEPPPAPTRSIPGPPASEAPRPAWGEPGPSAPPRRSYRDEEDEWRDYSPGLPASRRQQPWEETPAAAPATRPAAAPAPEREEDLDEIDQHVDQLVTAAPQEGGVEPSEGKEPEDAGHEQDEVPVGVVPDSSGEERKKRDWDQDSFAMDLGDM